MVLFSHYIVMQIKITVLPKHGEVLKEFICQFLETALVFVAALFSFSSYQIIIGLASKESGFSYEFFTPFKAIFSFSKTFSASYIKTGIYWLLMSTFAMVGEILLAATIVGIPLALMVFLWLT